MNASPIYHFDIVQGSPEWHAIKTGKWSASVAAVIMGGLDTLGIESLVKDIAWGRLFGETDAGFTGNKATQRGHTFEPEARDWFAFERDVVVEECGFVEHATAPNVGWSPDGLHSKRRRGIEAKAPLHKAFMDMLRTGKVPSEYRWQTKWACWVGDLDGLDFVGYHPKAGGLIVPVEITDADKDQMAARVLLLERRVAEWTDIIQNRGIAA